MHAHLFRHGYAINFLNCGGRLDALQEQLGHRDINTTRIYLRLSDEDVKREVAKCNSKLSFRKTKVLLASGGAAIYDGPALSGPGLPRCVDDRYSNRSASAGYTFAACRAGRKVVSREAP